MEGCRNLRILTRLAITTTFLLLLIHPSTQNTRRKREIATEQPRILTQNGHMVFQTGTNHNISFQSVSGGFINFDGENFKAIVQTVKDNQQQIKDIQDGDGLTDVTQRLSTVESRLDDLQPTGEVDDQLTDLNNRLSDLTDRLTTLESQPRPTPATGSTSASASNGRQIRRIKRRLTTVEGQLSTLNTLLATDECASNPCRNGGTCVDGYDKFWCQCPPEWEGITCETDVNECNIYAGTDLGCQNGATCVNFPGGYSCQCAPNFHGVRCTEKHDDCDGASQEALCGHGTCINTPRDDGQRSYTCICDEGWTTDGNSPECTTDVDECTESQRPPCSVDPEVMCINLPGSYTCGPCPTGYTGNGHVCTDINECLQNNGGCSTNPLVECINTRGSRTCGPCPSGYVGDGISCHYVGFCYVNNGGCYPGATCTDNQNVIDGRTCTCPDGMVGNGIGPSGCVSTSGDCSSSPCVHGTCVVSGSGYLCICEDGWDGVNCQLEINPCASNPCQNGGLCINRGSNYVCNCTSAYTGTNCEEEVNVCGGFLNSDIGTLKYPTSEQSDGYPHGVSCAWVITVTNGKVVKMTFTTFHLEYHPSCDFDFLQIHDGPDPSSHMIGQYCGDELPEGGTINSTHNQVYLWFRSDESVAHDGFEMIWQAVTPVCGGDLRGTDHGMVQSPGYPGDYPHNADCVWTITVSMAHKVQLTFGEIAIEHHSNCSYDYLVVYDGLLESDPILARYCSTQSPPPLMTTGPYARIYFHSDASLNDAGFEIRYTAIPTDPGCGGHFTDDTAIIISPNYPNAYNHNGQCVWTITVPDTETLTITFTDMDIEYHDNCIWDYVEIRDGLDETAPSAGKFCGTTIPAPYTTTHNNAYIRFQSDASNAGAGFRLVYVVACGGVFTAPAGMFNSPYYPEPYPHNKICTYLFTAHATQIIVATFSAFDVEDATSSGTCEYDYLAVHDGAGEDSSQIGKYCGAAIPGPIQSSTNNLWMKFKTDSSVNNHGFLASYVFQDSGTGGGEGGEDGSQEVPSEDCGGNLVGDEGTFSSPGHPNNYPHGVNCSWFIQVSAGSVIRLTFDSFNIEYHDNCNYDYVEIFDSDYSTSLGKYCGATSPPVLTSTDNRLKVTLASDDSIAVEGFSASYVAVNATSVCGGTFIENTGVLLSPNYPDDYPHNRQCEYFIVVTQGQQILLNTSDFVLEQHANCLYDYLEIRNGGYETSPLIGRYCGTTIDPLIRSDSNRMYLKFVSDGSQSAKGFQLYYDGTLSGCGGELTTPTGSLVSPNFPSAYGHNAECYWTITISRGSVIELTFLSFDVEFIQGCYYDYVQVRDESQTGEELGRLCGDTIPDAIRSKSNRLWIKFRTDYSNAGGGFHATYTSDCNNNLMTHYGVIESPNFPNTYPHNRDCVWTVQATRGNSINASFSHFEVEAHEECNYDFVEIRDGPANDSTLIGHYCGLNTIIPPIATSSEYLYVRFKSDASLGYNGFRMEYVMNGCGAAFTTPTGGFTSPNYPQAYAHNRECIWTISVEEGSSIELVLHDYAIESHVNCDFDALEIYGGINDQSPLLSKICGESNKERKLTSTGNHMFIRFITDVSNAAKGFNATYSTKSGGCGGDYSVEKAVITSKNYPNAYPTNAECLWNIHVDEGHSVEFTFLDFDLEGHEDCSYDYVALFDGNSDQAPSLGRVCGASLPDPSIYTSTDNKLYIEMRSDSSVSGKGFNGTYETACGGHLHAETDGEIVSPGWPGKYKKLKNCTWIIEAEHGSDHVTLTFTHMDIEDTNDCAHDYVQVLDGNNANAPVLNTYCGTTIPGTITSEGSALAVIFVSDASDERSGFRATYTKSISTCGANLTSEHGAFNSPNYPNSYPNNVECVWTITTSPGNSVHLSFSFFNLERSEYCNHDYVEVRKDGSGGELIGRYCEEIPNNLTNGHNIWVKFKSNEDITGRGFMAQYNSVYGGAITGTSGQIASPLYPSDYPHRANYAWIITAPSNLFIRVSFVDIDIEDSTVGCVYDWIAFKDGSTADLPEIARYCGTSLPDDLHTTGNQLRVEFISDYSSNGKGFLFNWDTVTVPPITPTTPSPTGTPMPGCGGDLFPQDAIQEFSSPGYPDGYDNNLDCQWLIQSPVGYRVWLNITDIWLEGHSTCNFDVVRVYDGDTTWGMLLGSFCDRLANEVPLVSTSNNMLVQFTTDSSVNMTGFLAQYKTACGGYVSGETGTIESPGFPNGYPANSNCTWYISVSTGRTITVDFEAFDIEGSGACTGQYLQFFNGGSTSSPPLGDSDGKYCGSTEPDIPETASYNLVISFYASKGSSSHTGFRLTYHEKAVECGGHLVLTNTVTSGTLTSPNYPNEYPHNLDCVWIITVPSHELVQLDFDDFEIEGHNSCNWDYVETRDGGTVNSPLLQKHCGTDKPSTSKTTGNVMYIRFRTDGSVGYKGFHATYSIAECGGYYSGDSGFITSPGYPGNYDSNLNCEYYISGPQGHYLTLTFETFSVQSSANCTDDFVEIREINSTGRIMGTYCGGTVPAPIDTPSGFAYVRFVTNSKNQYAGFKMSYQASLEECGGELTAPSGTLTSPNYPGVYAHHRYCVWHIRVQPSRRVTLIFNDLDIEHASGCYYDYVKVYNGLLDESPELTTVCGTEIPEPVQSSGNTMKIEFYTDVSVNGRGFSATYTSDEHITCGGLITSMSTSAGTIQSPGYNDDEDYPNNEQCVWEFYNADNFNSSINIQFTDFHIESHGECGYDFIEIREGYDETAPLIGRYCGNDTSNIPAVTVPTNALWMTFVSDSYLTDKGFRFNYKFTACGGVIMAENGVITSPNYPNPYDHNDNCVWHIIAPEGSKITTHFTNFAMENHNTCGYDFLKIYNGGMANSPTVGDDSGYCGTKTPPDFTSMSHEMRIEFSTDGSGSDTGFRMEFNSSAGGCGGVIHAQSGTIQSPSHPANYPANTECIWDINVANGYHVQLNFLPPFDLEIQDPCVNDYVEVSQYRHNGSLEVLHRFCGNQMPPEMIKADTNRMVVKFRSNDKIQGNGFKADFTAGCGAIYTDESGTIVSPGYPNNYDNDLNCSYTIISNPQHFIVLQFREFSVEGVRTYKSPSGGELPLISIDYDYPPPPGPSFIRPVRPRPYPGTASCNYDYLQVYEGNDTSGRAVSGKMCGSTIPQPASSLGMMHMVFITDHMVTDRGWLAKYETSECGGEYTDPSGTIRTPTQPDDYHHNANCSWFITVETDRIVELKFNNFDIEAHSRCAYDWVEIFDGPSFDSPSLGKFCGAVIPDLVRTSANTMLVNFITDSSVAKGGFEASYRTTFGEAQGCGGTFNASSGMFGSLDSNGDGTYESNLNCAWQIIVPQGKVVFLQFLSFNLEDAYMCHYDYVEIRDGLYPTDPLVGVFCGDQLPSNFTSASNVLYVKFITDGSVNRPGFNATFNAVNARCGGVATATATAASIASPGYPNAAYPQNIRCRWTIDAPENSQVYAAVDFMEIEAHPSCERDYLEFRDFPLGDDGRSVHLCGNSTPSPFISAGRSLQINFVSDYAEPRRGFHLNYQIASCNRTYTADNGQVWSPGHPGNYPVSAYCDFSIQVSEGNSLSIFFNTFFVEQHTECAYDYLKVFNGSSATSPLLATLCGNVIPNPITVPGNMLFFQFRTDYSVTHEGYDITYTSSPEGCGGSLTGTAGSLASPGYPGSNPQNQTCGWMISVSARRVISLEFTSFDVGGTADSCGNNYVKVYDGASASSDLLTTHCGSERPALVMSTGSKMFVKYSSDATNSGTGFYAKYTS